MLATTVIPATRTGVLVSCVEKNAGTISFTAANAGSLLNNTAMPARSTE